MKFIGFVFAAKIVKNSPPFPLSFQKRGGAEGGGEFFTIFTP
jgi:hypothetical protein